MERKLIAQAMEARRNSYCPYSDFAVGAALLTADGRIYTGCNIENASFTPTICAERTAFFKAVSEGVTEFSAIAIVGGRKDLAEGELAVCAPCGVCRQVMQEFCQRDFKVILSNGREEFETYTLEQLLPLGFSKENVK